MFKGRHRQFITYAAVPIILESSLGNRLCCNHVIRSQLLTLAHQELVTSVTMKRFILKTDQNLLDSSISTDQSPDVFSKKSQQGVKRISRKKILKKTLENLCNREFRGNVDELLKTLASLFIPGSRHAAEFDGGFGKENIHTFLSNIQPTDKKYKNYADEYARVFCRENSPYSQRCYPY